MRVERQVVFWLVALVVAAVLVVTLRQVLLPFVTGMILAYALNPLAEMLVRVGLPRVAASAVVVLLLVVCLVLAIVFLLPPLLAQVQSMAEALPTGLSRLRGVLEAMAKDLLGDRFTEFRDGLDRAVAGATPDWGAVGQSALRTLWDRGVAVANFASVLLLTPVVVFYLLVDWNPMLQRIDSWLPRDQAPTIRRLAGEMDAAVAAFVRGQGLVCLILGLFYAIGLSWAGLRYGLLVGLATGILSFVPFVGWTLGLVVAVCLALAQSWPDLVPFYVVIGVFLAGMALDAALLSPQIVGSRVGLHPLWLIFALFVFSYALGTVGVLIAVPLAAAVGVLVRYGLEVYLASGVYRGKGGA